MNVVCIVIYMYALTIIRIEMDTIALDRIILLVILYLYKFAANILS